MRPTALFARSIRLEIGLRLAKAEMIIRSTPDYFGIVFILPVITPKADFTDFILPAAVKSFEFAAWASVRRRHFLALNDILERLG
jgi:hypothetical protein